MKHTSMEKQHHTFGPPYAVFNLSKIGLRYFRICLNASPESLEKLTKQFASHPNIGWIFYAEGWFNFAIGIWARDNAEINDISGQIRKILGPEDRIVLQSELTSLYSFGDRKITGSGSPMCLVDSTARAVSLSPLEIDYLKLLALDSSTSEKELLTVLNISQAELCSMHHKMRSDGVIVGQQERINYDGLYFKVFVDSSSRNNENAVDDLVKRLWNDQNCVYFEKANHKYDLEFELVLDDKQAINGYVCDFSDVAIAILTRNVYTNLYPMNKIANLKEIRETMTSQSGTMVDFRNSKLWYLNYQAAQSYLDIYQGNERYYETMEKNETDMFGDIAGCIQRQYQDARFSLIDIGSGNGLKGRDLIQRIGPERVKAYYPVDIQPIELAAALHAHARSTYPIHPTLLDIENLSARFPMDRLPQERQLYLFFGGTYGNFEHGKINACLKPLVTSKSDLFISMPIIPPGTSSQDIIDSYYSLQYEDIGFGPLSQVGFTKENFRKNKERSEYIIHIAMEEGCLVGYFILQENVNVFGKDFKKGTVFKMLTSWKPTLDEFKNALEKNFTVKKIFTNKDMAIAMI